MSSPSWASKPETVTKGLCPLELLKCKFNLSCISSIFLNYWFPSTLQSMATCMISLFTISD